MILRSYRDVEIEFRKLLAQIEELRVLVNSSDGGKSGGIDSTQVIALIKQYANRTAIVNTSMTAPEDIDSANHGGVIIHHLIHNFISDVIFNGTVTGLPPSTGGNPFQFIQIKQPDPITTFWKFDNSGVENILLLSYVAATLFTLEFVAGTSLTTAIIRFPGHLGQEAARIKKVWTTDLSVAPSTGPAPAAGYILKAADTSGNVVWGPGGGGIQSAFASTNQSYGTSGVYTDISGCSINIPAGAIGQYFITANIVTQCVVNDGEFHIRAVHNQPGSFFAMTGEILLQKVPTEPGITFTSSYTWHLTVATTPCIVKLEKMKVGTGSSSIYIESSIIAVRVG